MSTQDTVEKWGARVNPKGHDKQEKEGHDFSDYIKELKEK
jgi:hypothetical protein